MEEKSILNYTRSITQVTMFFAAMETLIGKQEHPLKYSKNSASC